MWRVPTRSVRKAYADCRKKTAQVKWNCIVKWQPKSEPCCCCRQALTVFHVQLETVVWTNGLYKSCHSQGCHSLRQVVPGKADLQAIECPTQRCHSVWPAFAVGPKSSASMPDSGMDRNRLPQVVVISKSLSLLIVSHPYQSWMQEVEICPAYLGPESWSIKNHSSPFF
jgi:hypothetical protein